MATLLPELGERRQVRSSSPHFADGGPWKASETKTQKSGYYNHQVSSKAQKHSSMAPWSDVLEYGTVVRCSGAPLLMDA